MIVAVHVGDHETVQRLVNENPAVATSRLGGIAKVRTALHIVADWPGYFPKGPRIAQLLIDAGAALGIDVTAEGAETNDQLAGLKRLGCTRVQGYIFARPMPAAAMDKLVEESHHGQCN